eukprot:15472494-Alexandrium_andersonii.AAC.1
MSRFLFAGAAVHFVRARLQHFCGLLDDHEIATVCGRLKVIGKALPSFVFVAMLRGIANAWCTSARFGQE